MANRLAAAADRPRAVGLRASARCLCPALCLAWLAAGCTGPSRESVLDPMIGEDIETAIQTFGPPAETVDLGDGQRAYLWRRVYKYDKGRRARSWPERRLAGWTEESGEPADARVCSTRLVTDFDLRIRSWDYGCETVIVDRRRAASAPGDDMTPGHTTSDAGTDDPIAGNAGSADGKFPGPGSENRADSNTGGKLTPTPETD